MPKGLPPKPKKEPWEEVLVTRRPRRITPESAQQKLEEMGVDWRYQAPFSPSGKDDWDGLEEQEIKFRNRLLRIANSYI